MDCIFEDNNEDFHLGFDNLETNNYESEWMSDIFETVDDTLLNDQLMTDIASDPSHIKAETFFSTDDLLESALAEDLEDLKSSMPVLTKQSAAFSPISSAQASPPVSPNDCKNILNSSQHSHDLSLPTTLSVVKKHSPFSSPSSTTSSEFTISNTVTISSSSYVNNTSISSGVSTNGVLVQNTSSVVRPSSLRATNQNHQQQYCVLRPNNPTVYVRSACSTGASNGSSSVRPMVPRIKRPGDSYTSHYDKRPDSTTGYVLCPDTPPGSSNSSDCEMSAVSGGSRGSGDSGELSPVYPMSCYGNSNGGGVHSNSTNGRSSNGVSSSGSLSGSNNHHHHHHQHQPMFQSPIPQSGVLILTEEEKQTLISEGYPIPCRLPLTKQEERNLKKIRRKIKNKISAQESRRKKKEYLETLEKKVEAYSQENSELKRRLDNLETTNRSLLSQLRHLQQLAGKAGSSAAGTCLMVLVLCFAVFLAGTPSMNESDGLSATHSVNLMGSLSPNSLHLMGYAPARHHLADGGDSDKRGMRRYTGSSIPSSQQSSTGKVRPTLRSKHNNVTSTGSKEGLYRSSLPQSHIAQSRLLGSAKEISSDECVPVGTWWWFMGGSYQLENIGLEEDQQQSLHKSLWTSNLAVNVTLNATNPTDSDIQDFGASLKLASTVSINAEA